MGYPTGPISHDTFRAETKPQITFQIITMRKKDRPNGFTVLSFLKAFSCASNLFTRNVRLWLTAVHLVELVENGLCETFLAEDIRLEPPRQVLANLVFHVGTSRYGEDIVEFFEGALFRLWEPQEATKVSDDSTKWHIPLTS